MGGDFDWYGTGQSLGRVGEELLRQKKEAELRAERERLVRERQEEREYERSRERARARLEAARTALDAARALAKTPDDPNLQRALKEYEDALREYSGTQGPLLPRGTVPAPQPVPQKGEVGPKQAPQVGEAPAPRGATREIILTDLPQRERPLTFREYAKQVGLQLTPEQDASFGDRPAAEVLQLHRQSQQAGKPLFPQLVGPDREMEAQVWEQAERFVEAILSAPTPEVRDLRVRQARAWKERVLAQNPQLANVLGQYDFANVGQIGTSMARRAETLARQEDWKKRLAEAQKAFREAEKGADPYVFGRALAELNAVIEEGRRNGWTNASPIDINRVTQSWLKAREHEFRMQGLREKELEARIASLRRRASEAASGGGGEELTSQSQTYAVVTKRDNRGRVTGQYVIDRRTGFIVPPDVLKERAARGDREAAALLGYAPEPRRGEADPKLMSDEELAGAIQDLEASLAAPTMPGEDVSKRIAARRTLQQLKQEQARRRQARQQTLRNYRPSKEATEILRRYRQTKAPVPRELWGLLSEQDREWLEANGVQVAK